VRVNVEVHEGIHRLSRGVCNFYLIEQSGKFILVDAGAPGDWAFFGQALTSLGGKLADLDAVLLTHAHPDHVGIAERARTQAAAQVWIHQADAEAAKDRQCRGEG
jgi:glyoxylase-like metal-dependent hydrolase (beta-lactamase superfamily II)